MPGICHDTDTDNVISPRLCKNDESIRGCVEIPVVWLDMHGDLVRGKGNCDMPLINNPCAPGRNSTMRCDTKKMQTSDSKVEEIREQLLT